MFIPINSLNMSLVTSYLPLGRFVLLSLPNQARRWVKSPSKLIISILILKLFLKHFDTANIGNS